MDAGLRNARRHFAPVHYVCDRRLMRRGPGHTLTMYEGKWAYCGAMHAEPHHWVPTGGIPFFQILGSDRRKAGA